ncbi:hypothetical protein RU08_04135 [Pseudomonas fulva]|uniref:Uncharacterized protein n=1 Tax=Pseudomonas fulva TaxID=47880 RepID=A0A0D0L539_9PSED|nr:hypothetical protein RU08_04135 [Pseudomonas fulva]
MVGTARMQRMATIAFAPMAALLPEWLHPNDFAGASILSDRATRRMVGTARMQRMATIAFAPRAALLPE